MRSMTSYLYAALTVTLSLSCTLKADDSKPTDDNKPTSVQEETQPAKETQSIAEKPIAPPAPKVAAKPFEAFTGKVTKNKVRLRLQPTLDGPVLRELNRNDLLVVLGETDEFYALKPPANMKAYIFRTYVLDNVVEGSRVNVRLKPELDAPVVAQLNSGDRVEGVIDTANNKWMEIILPETARFFVSKEYIEKVGDAGLKARLDKRHDEVYRLLNTTQAISEAEMQKPFDQINLEGIVANYKKITLDYTDFPDAAEKAKAKLAALQESYATKKIAHLELQTRQATVLQEKNRQLSDQLKDHQSKLTALEQQVKQDRSLATAPTQPAKPQQMPANMSAWLPVEEAIYATWSENAGGDINAFYQEQTNEAISLKGIIEPYQRPVKNKPGDFLLVSATTRQPIAFLYSTTVNLQDFAGHEVALVVTPRPNNHYAFPAYFVLSME